MKLTGGQRIQVSQIMSDRRGLNKCEECCLVPDCPTCGPCAEHDDETETKAVLAWAGEHGIDLAAP